MWDIVPKSGFVASIQKIKDFSNYRNGSFHNISPTPVMAEGVPYSKVILESLRRPKSVKPPVPLPSVKSGLTQESAGASITWFGHSSYLIRTGGRNILVDPVFSGHASPISWMVKAFPGTDIYQPEDFPDIDLLIITHNHYDHLDVQTVRRLQPKVKAVVTTLGVSSFIPFIERSLITELNWWERLSIFDSGEITALPARHFSGRGIKRNGSLWASFALRVDAFNIFVGGDSGYDSFFTEIGERFGPFDIAVLECGQYNKYWPYIHMMPEQTAQAAVDLKAKALLPVHWGKFALANHPWNDSIARVVKKAAELGVKITTPMIGEQVILNETYPHQEWWNL